MFIRIVMWVLDLLGCYTSETRKHYASIYLVAKLSPACCFSGPKTVSSVEGESNEVLPIVLPSVTSIFVVTFGTLVGVICYRRHRKQNERLVGDGGGLQTLYSCSNESMRSCIIVHCILF